MLENVTKNQLRYLWICFVIVIICVLINKTSGIVAGIIFIWSFFSIEVWNNAKEKQQLKNKVKEIEDSHRKPTK